jgi:hypothetical protein
VGEKYTIEVSITPLCASCGEELKVVVTQSRTPTGPLDRDNPYERTHRRVFISACDKCYEFKGGRE